MRKLAVLTAVAASVLAIPMAQARTQATTTTFTTSTLQVGYGHTVTLAGTVSTHRAGVAVSILSRPFNKATLAAISTVRTTGGGHWRYVATPRIATTYAAAVGPAESRSLMVGVRPAIDLMLSRVGGVVAKVGGIPTFAGKSVQLQQAYGKGAWHTIAKAALNRHSIAVFSPAKVHPGASRLRVVMSVNQAGKGYLAGFSAPLRYPAHAVSLAASGVSVTYGGSVLLTGQVSLKQRATVQILARPFMRAEFQPVATVHTTSAGRFTYTVTPPFQTSFAARFGNGVSRAVTVGVSPKMTTRLLAGDRIWAHVGLAKSVTGKPVQIQQRQADGSWKTVAQLKLNAKATAIFAPSQLPGGTSTLRAAISVNKVGAGFLAGFGAPFTYHR